MNASLLLALALAAIPPGEIKTIIAVEADIVFRESLPSLPDDFGDKKPKGSAFAESDQKLPELWYWSHEGCVYCRQFEKDYESNKESAGFKPVKQESQRPTWMPSSDPQFWWSVNDKQPTQKDVNNTRHQNGYGGWKDLSGKFDRSRSPKKFERSSSSFHDGQQATSSAQPDLNKIGSRSVAQWSIDGDFTPSRSALLSHLSSDGIHRGRHDREFLETLTTEQMRWLHDSDHNGSPAGRSATVMSGKNHGTFLWWSW